MKALSMSFMKTSVLMCSVVRLTTLPTTTEGVSPRTPVSTSRIQLPVMHIATMESATILASVSFHQPLRSVTVPGSVLVTVLPQPQAAIAMAAERQSATYLMPKAPFVRSLLRDSRGASRRP